DDVPASARRAEQELSRAPAERDDQRSVNELQPVRSRGGAHLQDLWRQDARDRGDRLLAAALLEERLESVHQVAPYGFLESPDPEEERRCGRCRDRRACGAGPVTIRSGADGSDGPPLSCVGHTG